MHLYIVSKFWSHNNMDWILELHIEINKIELMRPSGGELVKMMHESGGPNPDSFKLPRIEAEWNLLLSKMKECGIDHNKAIEIMREKREKYIEACLLFHNKNV